MVVATLVLKTEGKKFYATYAEFVIKSKFHEKELAGGRNRAQI